MLCEPCTFGLISPLLNSFCLGYIPDWGFHSLLLFIGDSWDLEVAILWIDLAGFIWARFTFRLVHNSMTYYVCFFLWVCGLE